MGDFDRRCRFEGVPHRVVEEGVDVGAEAAHDARRADHVLQDEGPADEEGDELAHRHVAVDVGRAGAWNSRAEFRIAETYRV